MNQFAETYKKFNNETLFNILQNSGDYEPEAVEAARLELVERQLSDEEIDEANQIVEKRSQQKRNQLNRQDAFVSRIRYFFNELINPNRLTVENTIKALSVFFTVLAAFRLYHQLVFLKYLFVENKPLIDSGMLGFYLDFLIVPVWIVLLWRRHPIAWICLVAFITYIIISANYGLFKHFIDVNAAYNRFASVSPMPVTGLVILAIAFLCCSFTKNARVAFNVNRVSVYAAILLGVIFTTFWFISL